VCTLLGIGALLAGILGLLLRQWESGIARILLALFSDRMPELGPVQEQLDRLLDQACRPVPTP